MTIVRYARSAILLHWTIAGLLAFQLGLGWRMVALPPGAAVYPAFQLHKSVGILILLLSVARLALRFARPSPAPVPATRAAAMLARAVHALLYVVMIAGPLTGWAVVSTARIAVPTRLFGIMPLPHLPLDRMWNGVASTSHAWLAWLGVALFALHVGGALRHHLGRLSHPVLERMMPLPGGGQRATPRRSFVAVGAALAILAICFLAPGLGGLGVNTAASPPKPATVRTPVRAIAPPAAKPVPSPTATIAAAPPEDEGAAIATAVAPSRWTVAPGGRLGFTASMNGTPIVGTMTRWSADILFDPEALAKSRIIVGIALLSADTGDASRDEMLKGDDFFGSAGGEATYRSDSIVQTGRNRYRAEGSLMMNGRSRRVPLSFSLDIVDDLATVSGAARLDRVSFGIGGGQWATVDQIAADVAIAFQFRARRAAVANEGGEK